MVAESVAVVTTSRSISTPAILKNPKVMEFHGRVSDGVGTGGMITDDHSSTHT